MGLSGIRPKDGHVSRRLLRVLASVQIFQRQCHDEIWETLRRPGFPYTVFIFSDLLMGVPFLNCVQKMSRPLMREPYTAISIGFAAGFVRLNLEWKIFSRTNRTGSKREERMGHPFSDELGLFTKPETARRR